MFNNLTGRPTYNGGASFAPNRGSVGASGAQGYLKRELRKRSIQQSGGSGPFGGVSKFGSDGSSDTRSGIAGNMLNQFNGGRPNVGHQAGPMPVNGGRPPHPGQHQANGPMSFDGGRPNVSGVRQPGQWGQATDQNHVAPQPPHVTIGKDGTLKLPYDYQTAQTALDAQAKLNQELLALQQSGQQASASYLSGTRQNELGYADDSRQALAGRASQGTAYSSAYGNDVSQLATGFNNQKANLDTSYNQFNQQAEFQKNQAVTYMNQLLQQLAVERAENLHSQAGQLGYGHVKVHPPKGKGTKKGSKK